MKIVTAKEKVKQNILSLEMLCIRSITEHVGDIEEQSKRIKLVVDITQDALRELNWLKEEDNPKIKE